MSSANPPASPAKPAPSIDAFLASLDKCRLVGPAQLDQIRKFLTGRNDVKSTMLARWLVEKKFITAWQTEELLGGRTKFHLQKYKLLEKIGAGANGTVFKAEQTGMSRIVALKVMPDEVAKKPENVARFKQETRLAASLHHPHIITAYDAECDGDTHFLVMEYMDGKDLNQWLADHQPLPVKWACECIRQAALGLQHAHGKGLVHRDIKPGNLLCSGKGIEDRPVLKVLDMGFARDTNDEGGVRLTKAWQIFGTPDYMAPEQAESTLSADIRCDIYSLGVTLFKLLTGQLPFKGETPLQKLMTRANNDAPRVSTLRKDVPVVLDSVVAKMLARKPEQRYQTPGDVVAALEPFSWDGTAVASVPARSTDPAAVHGGAEPMTMSSISMIPGHENDDSGPEFSIAPQSGAIRKGQMTPMRPPGSLPPTSPVESALAPATKSEPPKTSAASPSPAAAAASAPATPSKAAPAPAALPTGLPSAAEVRGATYLGVALGALIGLTVGGIPGAILAALLWKAAGEGVAVAAAVGLFSMGLSIGIACGGVFGLLHGLFPKSGK